MDKGLSAPTMIIAPQLVHHQCRSHIAESTSSSSNMKPRSPRSLDLESWVGPTDSDPMIVAQPINASCVDILYCFEIVAKQYNQLNVN